MALVGGIVNECNVSIYIGDFDNLYSDHKRARGHGMKYKIIYDPSFEVYILIISDSTMVDGVFAKVISQAQVDLIEEAERNARSKLSTAAKKKLYN